MDPATVVSSATIDAGILDQAAGSNPLLPTLREPMALVLGGALIALVVVAIISLSRDRHYTAVQRLLWLPAILAVPVLGAVLWSAVGRRVPVRR
ncbi:PLD nuclease N-terminal domain-containing protein [Kocuria sp. NPDC057446]|uniref:PLD nuclease N-terminal domain-containing protein n=1 Tax=Kocuria sp. NPDC057446 TaxID=3346137 RepID=UPI0036AC3F79